VPRASTLLVATFLVLAGCGAPDVILHTQTPISGSGAAGPTSPSRPNAPGGPNAAPATGAPTTAPRREFTLAVTGDILLHTSVNEQARQYADGAGYDFRPMFSAVRPVIAGADLGICHLETPIAPPGERLSTYPIYGVPAQIIPAIKWAGYDRCSLASNHSMDRGTKGIDATLAGFDAAKLGHTGMARRPAEAAPSLFTVNGVRVAHLSYTFSYNGLRAPKGQPWRSNLIDPPRIIAQARQARARGAEFVILSMHWGSEGSSQVTSEQRRQADVITRSGAVDLIVGHHAHVLQPIETVNGRWVVFGLGNLISGMGSSTKCCGASAQDGAIVRIRVTEHPRGFMVAGKPEVIPTYVDQRDYVIRPVPASLRDPSTAEGLTSGLRRSLQRTERVLGPYLVAS
jgi:poly-gamma-glutamate synthesis protein (capsule biosynthesis protein)